MNEAMLTGQAPELIDPLLVTCGYQEYCRVYDTETGSFVRQLPDYMEPYSACSTPDGRYFLITNTRSTNTGLYIYDVENDFVRVLDAEVMNSIPETYNRYPTSTPRGLAVSDDSRYAAYSVTYSSSYYAMVFIDLNTGEVWNHQLPAAAGVVQYLGSKGKFIYSVTGDSFREYDPVTKTEVVLISTTSTYNYTNITYFDKEGARLLLTDLTFINLSTGEIEPLSNAGTYPLPKLDYNGMTHIPSLDVVVGENSETNIPPAVINLATKTVSMGAHFMPTPNSVYGQTLSSNEEHYGYSFFVRARSGDTIKSFFEVKKLNGTFGTGETKLSLNNSVRLPVFINRWA